MTNSYGHQAIPNNKTLDVQKYQGLHQFKTKRRAFQLIKIEV